VDEMPHKCNWKMYLNTSQGIDGGSSEATFYAKPYLKLVPTLDDI
jgi:hypothetical protein